MITVILQGGLGNQMHEFSMGFAQAARLGTDLCLDVTRCEGPQCCRPYSLDSWKGVTQPIVRGSRITVREQGFSYNQALVNSIKDGDCLEGYWQTEKYHEPVRQSLLDIFTPKRPLGSQSKRLAEEILALGHKSVSIHVRRSDYLRPPHCGYHNILDMEHYYLPAIQKVLEKVEDAWFFVFSDDPEWCRANFAPVASVHQKFWIVDHNRPGGPLFGLQQAGNGARRPLADGAMPQFHHSQQLLQLVGDLA